MGAEEWRRVFKWMPTAFDTAVAALERAGWRILDRSLDRNEMAIAATAGVADLAASGARFAASVDRAAAALRFN